MTDEKLICAHTRHRLMISTLIIVLLVGLVIVVKAAIQPEERCVTDTGQVAPKGFVAHKITHEQAHPGPGLEPMGPEGATACVHPETKKMLDDPHYMPLIPDPPGPKPTGRPAPTNERHTP